MEVGEVERVAGLGREGDVRHRPQGGRLERPARDLARPVERGGRSGTCLGRLPGVAGCLSLLLAGQPVADGVDGFDHAGVDGLGRCRDLVRKPVDERHRAPKRRGGEAEREGEDRGAGASEAPVALSERERAGMVCEQSQDDGGVRPTADLGTEEQERHAEQGARPPEVGDQGEAGERARRERAQGAHRRSRVACGGGPRARKRLRDGAQLLRDGVPCRPERRGAQRERREHAPSHPARGCRGGEADGEAERKARRGGGRVVGDVRHGSDEAGEAHRAAEDRQGRQGRCRDGLEQARRAVAASGVSRGRAAGPAQRDDARPRDVDPDGGW